MPAPAFRRPLRAAFASLALHGILLAAFALMPTAEQFAPPAEDTIPVEVVIEQQSAPTAPPAAMASPAAPPATATMAPPPVDTTPSGPVRASKLFSDTILDSPQSSGTRALLAQLDEAERIEQLCNLEAMSQIHAWKADLEPDRVIAYTMAATTFSDHTLRADGAVFRSKQHWYRLRFSCEMARSHQKVVAFSFELGDSVPRREWASRNLPPIH